MLHTLSLLRENLVQYNCSQVLTKVLSYYKEAQANQQELSRFIARHYTDTLDNKVLPGHLSIPRASFKALFYIQNFPKLSEPLSDVIINKYNTLLDEYIANVRSLCYSLYEAQQLDATFGMFWAKVIEFQSLSDSQLQDTLKRYTELSVYQPDIKITSGIDFYVANSGLDLNELHIQALHYTHYIEQSKILREQWEAILG